jgi:hypothetical protein
VLVFARRGGPKTSGQHLVKGVAVIAHDSAGFRDVAECLSRLQQGLFPLGTLRERSCLGSSGEGADRLWW